MFYLGTFAHEKRLAKALRQRPLEFDAIQELHAAVIDHHQFRDLPGGFLYRLAMQAQQAMQEVPEQSPLWKRLYSIFRSCIGEYENRFRAW